MKQIKEIIHTINEGFYHDYEIFWLNTSNCHIVKHDFEQQLQKLEDFLCECYISSKQDNKVSEYETLLNSIKNKIDTDIQILQEGDVHMTQSYILNVVLKKYLLKNTFLKDDLEFKHKQKFINNKQ